MLTENKFSKYLLYAIGEIILVVIGILIALSINNWNENKKTQNQLSLILYNLIEDLNDEIKDLEINLGKVEDELHDLNEGLAGNR